MITFGFVTSMCSVSSIVCVVFDGVVSFFLVCATLGLGGTYTLNYLGKRRGDRSLYVFTFALVAWIAISVAKVALAVWVVMASLRTVISMDGLIAMHAYLGIADAFHFPLLVSAV